MKNYNILIVEDDESVLKQLKQILEDEGANIKVNTTGEDVVAQVADIHLILMDIMLPFDDGLSIIKSLPRSSNIPVIYLTARSDIDIKLEGLKTGEDYITKPFHPLELISRIEKILERCYRNDYIQIKHLYVDEKGLAVFNRDMHEISLTAKERQLFFYLYRNKGITLSKEQLMDMIWSDGETFDNILSVYVKKLRQKIKDVEGELIKTIHGIGYRMMNHEE